jgi:hypothetical protein
MTPRPPELARRFHYRAFALPLSSVFRLPGLAPAPPDSHSLSLELALASEIERLWSGSAEEPIWTTAIDGRAYTMSLGSAGDYLMTYGDDAVFHLSRDARELRCAPAVRSDLAWQRFLLDTVLWSASLLRGVELLHASAVRGTEGVVAFAGFTGSGKTSLAAELIRRGGALFTDDILALPPTQGLRAHPGPPVMNLPNAQPGGRGPSDIGEPLARFSGEDWVQVRSAAAEPGRVAAVCLLRSRRGAAPTLRRLQPTVLDLLPFALGFSGSPERTRQRFLLFSRLAAEVPTYELSVSPGASPSLLADLVEPLVLGAPERERVA